MFKLLSKKYGLHKYRIIYVSPANSREPLEAVINRYKAMLAAFPRYDYLITNGKDKLYLNQQFFSQGDPKCLK